MLKKKLNKLVLKLIPKIEELLKGIDCAETNMGGRDFIISRNLSSEWAENSEYASICICGGRNSGRGLWSEYMKSLSEAIKRIEDTYTDVFIDKIVNDVCDDIFYAYVIIRMK